jgi:hypothetical protein
LANAADDTSTIDALIEAHRAAWQTFNDRCGDLDDIESAYKAANEHPLTPLVITPLGTGDHIEVLFDNPDNAADQIRAKHQALRERHCSAFAKSMAPAQCEAMEAALRRSQRNCLRRLKAAFAREAARREAFGLTQAQRDWDAMAEADKATLMAVISYVPRNPDEAQAKSEHLSWWTDRGNDLEAHEVQALIGSIGAFA